MFDGRINAFRPNYSVLGGGFASEGQSIEPEDLPSFLRIFNILLQQTSETEQEPGPTTVKNFLTNVSVLHDVAFSPKCPILGTGHHFVVYASPFEAVDYDFTPMDGRAFNNEVYCLKIANFASNGVSDGGSSIDFRKDYYNTVLQELRVLLHPEIRTCASIINLFGLDFQQDYDEYKIAWPVLIMEYAEYGTLDTLQEDFEISGDLSRALLLDVARGINAVHKANIIHGDIKSENVVICRHHQRKFIARLADFGLSLINPDPSIEHHRLPGGTLLWCAPEWKESLSVEGLRKTDVYSFGLMAWRVWVNHREPYGLIPPGSLGTSQAGELDDTVMNIKSHSAFPEMVLQTLRSSANYPEYGRHVIEAALHIEPSKRSLSHVIWTLSQEQEQEENPVESEVSQAYWAEENPFDIMVQLCGAFPDRIIEMGFKVSALYSLADDLDAVFALGTDLSSFAGWIQFLLASDTRFQTLTQNPENCFQILQKLCETSFPLALAIVVDYYKLYGKMVDDLDPAALSISASGGSSYAILNLRRLYPDTYQRLLESALEFENDESENEYEEPPLLNHLRRGDYEECVAALSSGASACPEREGKPSALHWLISFEDEQQIHHILGMLIENGAVIDHWEGNTDDDDLLFGRIVGTPLHWAVWYRNIPLVRALTTAESQPDIEQADRAILIASLMHSHDVLEILRDWVISIDKPDFQSYDWSPALLQAAGIYRAGLPRRLHYGSDNTKYPFEQTMEVITQFYTATKYDVDSMFFIANKYNVPDLLRYLFNHLNLINRKDLLEDPQRLYIIQIITLGYYELFDIYIRHNVIGPDTEVSDEKWKPLQVCSFSRQRNTAFVTRLLDMGCPPDIIGGTAVSKHGSFGIAVAMGLYHIAILLLERGADKDHITGWAGGYTVTQNMLSSWPDLPISRLRFMIEEVPRLGFGHVAWLGWPGANGNLLYGLALSHWSSYTAGYRLVESAKYILSNVADKSCLNRIDKVGATALRMACASGNQEIIRVLIENGQDVNLAAGYSPLRNATDWLEKCEKREKAAYGNKKTPGSEKRLARMLRIRAQQTIELLEAHGAIDRNFVEAMRNTTGYIENLQHQAPSFETIFEMFSTMIDTTPNVTAGSTPLNPTSRDQFRAHHGKKGVLQTFVGKLGQKMDNMRGSSKAEIPARYAPHSCWPWKGDLCTSQQHSQGDHQQHFRNEQQNMVRGYSLSPIPTLTSYKSPLSSSSSSSSSSSRVVPQYIPPTQPYPFTAYPSPQPYQSTTQLKPQPYQPTTHFNTQPYQPLIQHTPPARTSESAIKKIRDRLLLYFLEEGGSEASAQQRHETAIRILHEEFEGPLKLQAPCQDIGACSDFYKIKEVVENCLEVMSLVGFTLIPELSDDGGELFIYVCAS